MLSFHEFYEKSHRKRISFDHIVINFEASRACPDLRIIVLDCIHISNIIYRLNIINFYMVPIIADNCLMPNN